MIYHSQKHESEILEFKKSSALWKEACDDIVAMANKSWGELYFGIEDNGEILWQTKAESTIRNLVNDLRWRIDPQIHFSLCWEEFEWLDVIKITVPKSETPYHTSADIAYIRSGSVSQKMSKSEHQSRLMRYNPKSHDFSSQKIPDATIADIDPIALSTLRKKLSGSQRVNFEIPNNDWELLKSLHLMQDNQLTYAAIILLGTELATRKYIPYAELSYWYRLSDSDSYNQDEFIGRGGFLCYADDLWKKIDSRNIRLNISIGLGIDTTRMAFEEETIREGINNAVIHRDYSERSNIFVIQYSQKLEVISPGGLPDGVTLENMADESRPRNKLLADVLRWCDMVDEFWNGVNKMIKNQLKLGKNAPSYSKSTDQKVFLELDGTIVDLDFARYVIKAGSDTGVDLNDRELMILQKIKNKQRYHQSDISQKILQYHFVEKVGRGKYMLSRQYYEDHNQKWKFTEDRPMWNDEIKLLIFRFIKDNKWSATKKDILSIESLKNIHQMQIYRLLCQLRDGGYLILDGKPRSPKAKWKIIKDLTITF